MSRGEIAGRRTKDTDFSSSRRETLECSRVWRSVSPLFSLSLLSVSLNPSLDQSRFPHVTAVHPIGGFRGEIFCFSFDFANRSSSFISCRKRRVKASADQKIIFFSRFFFSRFFSLRSESCRRCVEITRSRQVSRSKHAHQQLGILISWKQTIEERKREREREREKKRKS